MKLQALVLRTVMGVVFFAACVTRAADGVWLNASSGNWSESANWVGGTIAQEGGTATFKAASETYIVSNDLGTVVLSGMTGNEPVVGDAAWWDIAGGTIQMVAPALINTQGDRLSVRASTLSGSTDLLITGLGKFFLGDDNLYTGRTIISNGNVRVARDSGLGPVPETLRTDSIILDNGGLENDDSDFILETHANRGITVTANGGYLGAGYTRAGMTVNGPITGPGLLGINYENSPVTLNNTANDYTGGTWLGTMGPGFNTNCAPTLKIGQNEVLPDGAGKGGLTIGHLSMAITTLPWCTLDMNGKTETVNTLDSGPNATIGSSVANQGRLIVGGLNGNGDYRGRVEGGATIEKQGSGTLFITNATVASGTVDLKAGTLTARGGSLPTGSTVLFNGGGLNLFAADGYNNELGGRLLLVSNGTLTVSGAAGKMVFGGMVATNGVADPEPVLTVANGGLPFLFGSTGTYPAVLDASVSSAGGIVFTNRVWLRRMPGTYSIAAGADLALDGTSLLGDTALNLTSYSVRVVRSDSVGGDGSVTANSGTAVWFDTMRYDSNALNDLATTVPSYVNDVTLNGGSVGFSGAGTITYNGTITGSGTAVKNGTGDLLLSDTGSSISGEIQVNAGRLRPASEAALGGATVRLNGGRLANLDGQDLLLSTTPIYAQTGGFEAVGAGHALTVNSVVTGLGEFSKWGAGTLVLGGTALNDNFQFYAREGSVELAKTGAAANYAVLNLMGVQSNTVVRLTGNNGNQIGGSVTLDGGILDLNGHSETIGALASTLSVGSVVTNGGSPAATLTVGDGGASSLFSGRITDGTSALTLAKTGSGTLTLSAESIAYTGGTQVEGGTLRIQRERGVRAKYLRFAPTVTRPAGNHQGSGYQLSEFQVMMDGVAVANPAGTTAYAAVPDFGTEMGPKAVDGDLGTKWYCGTYGNPLTITFGEPVTFNSYRWATANDAEGRDPVSWTVELGVEGAGGAVNWYLMDTQTGYDPTWSRNTWIGTNFVVHTPLNNVIPDNHPVFVATGARLALSNLTETVENLTGNGTLLLENSVVTLTDYTGFTGTVASVGTLVLKAADGASPNFTVRDLGVTVRNDGALAATFLFNSSAINIFGGSLQDGTSALGITQSGSGTTCFAGTNSTYTGATLIETGVAAVSGATYAKYVKFTPLLMRSGSDFDCQISEFELLLNGEKVAYPAGTSASTSSSTYTPHGEDPPQAIDGDVGTKFYNGISPVAPLVITLPDAVFFDAYRWYTANDVPGRDPLSWKVEASMDGVNWTVADNRSGQTITETRFTLAGTYSIAQFTADMNVFSDQSATTVASPGALNIGSTRETVGALSGNGSVLLTAATLGINAFQNAAFSGNVTGSGSVVKTGAATQTLSGALSFSGTIAVENGVLDLTGAVLTGVTNIVIKTGGTLSGAATVSGDLTVTFEGGLYSASLAVSGALTVVGTVNLAVPNGTTYPLNQVLFSYASADPTTLSALTNAVKPSPIPSGHAATLHVTAASTRLVIAPVGMLISVK